MEVVIVGENGIEVDDVLVHDQTNKVLAQMLVSLDHDTFPVVLGIIYHDPAPSFGEEVAKQKQKIMEQKEPASLSALMQKGGTWEVK